METTVGLLAIIPILATRCSTPARAREAVRDAGVDFVITANNHILDRYYDGMMITIDGVKRLSWPTAASSRSQAQKMRQYRQSTASGLACSVTQSTNGMEDHSDPRATGSASAMLRGGLCRGGAKAAGCGRPDVVIACIMHWGRRYRRDANSAEAHQSEPRDTRWTSFSAAIRVMVQPAGMRETVADGDTKHSRGIVQHGKFQQRYG